MCHLGQSVRAPSNATARRSLSQAWRAARTWLPARSSPAWPRLASPAGRRLLGRPRHALLLSDQPPDPLPSPPHPFSHRPLLSSLERFHSSPSVSQRVDRQSAVCRPRFTEHAAIATTGAMQSATRPGLRWTIADRSRQTLRPTSGLVAMTPQHNAHH